MLSKKKLLPHYPRPERPIWLKLSQWEAESAAQAVYLPKGACLLPAYRLNINGVLAVTQHQHIFLNRGLQLHTALGQLG